MINAMELLEIHKKIFSSNRIQPESKDLYLKYVTLSDEDEQELVNLVINQYGTDDIGKEVAVDVLTYISIFSGGKSLNRLYSDLVKNNVFYPPELYLKAKEPVAELLIGKLENMSENDTVQINHILMCLSYIPCKLVSDYLQKASAGDKPAWAKRLYIQPIEYATYGGWIIDKNNNIKQLYNNKITVFKSTNGNSSSKAPLSKNNEVCPYCNNNLYTVFHEDYEIATCLLCSCYQNIYVGLDENGIAHWHPKNVKSDILEKCIKNGDELAAFDYALEESDENRLPPYTINQFVSISKSQLGGMPTNINDIPYPICPDCGEKMSFVAQLDMEDIMKYGEGIYYFFKCSNCKVVASAYDQT